MKSKKTCARVCLQREEANRRFSDGCQKAETQNADNVKARVLHVMNVNHTEKKAKHMQQKCVGSKQRRPWMFPFSNEENQKNTNNVKKQEVSRRWMESERS